MWLLGAYILHTPESSSCEAIGNLFPHRPKWILTPFGPFRVHNWSYNNAPDTSNIVPVSWRKTTSFMWIKWKLLAKNKTNSLDQKVPENIAHGARNLHTSKSGSFVLKRLFAYESSRNLFKKYEKPPFRLNLGPICLKKGPNICPPGAMRYTNMEVSLICLWT